MKTVKLNDNFLAAAIIIVSFPYLIFILPINFILSSIGIILGVLLLKLGNVKEIYYKTIGYVFLFSLISYLIGLGFIYLMQFFYPFDISNEMGDIFIIRNSLGFSASILVGILIFVFNRFITFKKIEIDAKNYFAIFLAIVSAPFFFLFPSNLIYEKQDEYSYLKNFDGVLVSDAYKIVSIIDQLDSGKYRDKAYLETNEVPFELVIDYKDEEIFNEYKIMEKDSAVLLRLITSLDIVTFNYKNKTYKFDKVYFEKIYEKSIKDISIEKIMERYKNNYFLNDSYIYLGNIYGSYDVFNIDNSCTEKIEVIYEDDKNRYALNCSEEFLVVNQNKQYAIKELLDKDLIKIEDIINLGVNINVEEK